MKRVEIDEVQAQLAVAYADLQRVEETFTGRDTNPLYDGAVHDPAAFFISCEVKRIEHSIAGMIDYLDDLKNYVED